jgi:hypothetical protein
MARGISHHPPIVIKTVTQPFFVQSIHKALLLLLLLLLGDRTQS